MKKIAKWTTAACAAAALALVAGCASVQDLEALQGQVDSLKGELAAAQAAADSAMSEAKAAGMAAGDAAGAADAAMNAASDAAAGGAANAEKLDRMFEKVMMK